MKKIITSLQTKQADLHTIQSTPLSPIDLMEKASLAFVSAFMQRHSDRNISILVCCGMGNNGGDGLAIARLLQEHGYDTITVWIARYSERESMEFTTNLARLHRTPIPIKELAPSDDIPHIHQLLVIDALLGSGLNKPLNGEWLRLTQHINHAHKQVISVDVPTGLRTDGIIPETEETIVAHHVISFQRPKLSFFFPESAHAMGDFQVVDIGLDENFIENLPSDFNLLEPADIQRIQRKRKPFSHKGTYGHALLIAGDSDTLGAAILACGASLYSGAGLTSSCIPQQGLTALNTRYPEVMYCPWESLDNEWGKFDAVGIGPGLGSGNGVLHVLNKITTPMVVDADALNFLAHHPSYLSKLPRNSVLTPHMKEFDRLFGPHQSWWDRVQTAKEQAATLRVIIVLKNQYTFIVLPNGRVLINPTGCPAMASGGMGDVLTGMLTSFLAQGYQPQDAAMLACYVHGAAGDHLYADGMEVIPAGKIVETIPFILKNTWKPLS